MGNKILVKTENDFEAENDARTLIDAEVIMNDPARMEAARKACEDMIQEEDARKAAMDRIANAKLQYTKSPQG